MFESLTLGDFIAVITFLFFIFFALRQIIKHRSETTIDYDRENDGRIFTLKDASGKITILCSKDFSDDSCNPDDVCVYHKLKRDTDGVLDFCDE